MREPKSELRNAILGLAGATTAAGDQAQAMTDAELAALLLSGRWTTIEVHEAGRRLAASEAREATRDQRDEWLRVQLDGAVADAEALATAVGLALARSLAGNLAEARAALAGEGPKA